MIPMRNNLNTAMAEQNIRLCLATLAAHQRKGWKGCAPSQQNGAESCAWCLHSSRDKKAMDKLDRHKERRETEGNDKKEDRVLHSQV